MVSKFRFLELRLLLSRVTLYLQFVTTNCLTKGRTVIPVPVRFTIISLKNKSKFLEQLTVKQYSVNGIPFSFRIKLNVKHNLFKYWFLEPIWIPQKLLSFSEGYFSFFQQYYIPLHMPALYLTRITIACGCKACLPCTPSPILRTQ